MWHIYKYVLKRPFRQDGHERLNLDRQLPYFYIDNCSRYIIVDFTILLLYKSRIVLD